MAQVSDKIVPVILSGGSGTRLWPLSRDTHPKQFIGVVDPQMPLIQATLHRVDNAARFHPPLMLGNNDHRFLLAENMRRCGIASPAILIEPSARNTAPAIAAAALYVKEHYGNALMLVLPTDHVIEDAAAFLEGVDRAVAVAQQGYLVTFGIRPTHPETGYGYIRRGTPIARAADTFQIASFVEKPDEATAKDYIATGEFSWNSGMFLFPADLLLEELQTYQPALLESCRLALENSSKDLDFIRLQEAAFTAAASISIDYALMEKTARAAMVTLACGWNDSGSWDTLWEIAPKDAQGNVTFGECHLLDTRDCYARSENGPAIATLGVDNLVVIATRDAVLVAAKDKAQSIKQLVAHLREKHPELVQSAARVFRPWGSYQQVHAGNRFQVKQLTVKPGEKLSLQMHYHRAEHWIVVSGAGKMTCDDVVRTVTENESFYVPCGSMHSIENPGNIPLEIIEVQSGSYLGEDDIVRSEDRYGRTDVVVPLSPDTAKKHG